jgi:hypothetical protein
MNGDAVSLLGLLDMLSTVYPACRNVEWVRHNDRLGDEANKLTESK